MHYESLEIGAPSGGSRSLHKEFRRFKLFKRLFKHASRLDYKSQEVLLFYRERHVQWGVCHLCLILGFCLSHNSKKEVEIRRFWSSATNGTCDFLSPNSIHEFVGVFEMQRSDPCYDFNESHMLGGGGRRGDKCEDPEAADCFIKATADWPLSGKLVYRMRWRQLELFGYTYLSSLPL